jgi:hypothetical protein
MPSLIWKPIFEYLVRGGKKYLYILLLNFDSSSTMQYLRSKVILNSTPRDPIVVALCLLCPKSSFTTLPSPLLDLIRFKGWKKVGLAN